METAGTLRRWRAAARLTQRELAARSGVPQSAIARIESGRVTPRVDTLSRLLAACGVSLEAQPRPGFGVDRTQIRELLRLTPEQRVRLAAEASRNLSIFLAKVQPQVRARRR